MAGKERINSRKATLAVLDILQRKTNCDNPISITQIIEEMKEYGFESHSSGKVTNKETVKKILNDLREFYGDKRVCCKSAEKRDYTYDYYWNAVFSDEETHMLISDVMFSCMRSKSEVKEVLKKLKQLAPKPLAKKLNYLADIPDRQYTLNEDVQKNVLLIHKAISADHVRLTFMFNGYGTDKKLHEKRKFTVLPLRICVVEGRYYLICLMDGKDSVSHFRIDLMTNMKEESVYHKNERQERLVREFNSKTVSEYISRHPYMYYENADDPVKTVYFKVQRLPKYPDASMTILHDYFGDDWQCVEEREEFVVVRVRCVSSAAEVYARQFADRVSIIEW